MGFGGRCTRLEGKAHCILVVTQGEWQEVFVDDGGESATTISAIIHKWGAEHIQEMSEFMAGNSNLSAAKDAKNDEFYTQYSDIEAEMNAYVEFDQDVFRDKTILLPCDDPEWSNFTKYFAANFTRFGLKKLISTSYARGATNKQMTLFEMESPLFDADKHDTHGKLFTLTRDKDDSGQVDTDDIEFSGYLEGDGDFRSAEVKALRDEADIIITNPPFSLFREFLTWILEGEKKFVILGNINAITYKEVFPLLRDNKIWLGESIHSGDRKFNVPDDYPLKAAGCGIDPDGRKFIRVKGVRWFTNIDHGLRHQPLLLDTMEHNLKFNKKLRKKLEKDYGKIEYPHYDNYDAIEVPFVEAIPSDYDGVMGVPITFLDKYNPEQFEIVAFRKDEDGNDLVFTRERERESSNVFSYPCLTAIAGLMNNPKDTKVHGQSTYARITIQWKRGQ